MSNTTDNLDRATGPIACLCCGTTMQRAQRKGVVFDMCYGCGAHWFDRGELDVLLREDSGIELVVEELGNALQMPQGCRFCNTLNAPGSEVCACGKELWMACPRDGDVMYIVSLGPVEIDFCVKCKGVWLDGYELKMLREHLELRPGNRSTGSQRALVLCPLCGEKTDNLITDVRGTMRCRDCMDEYLGVGTRDRELLERDYHRHWRAQRRSEAQTERYLHRATRWRGFFDFFGVD